MNGSSINAKDKFKHMHAACINVVPRQVGSYLPVNQMLDTSLVVSKMVMGPQNGPLLDILWTYSGRIQALSMFNPPNQILGDRKMLWE